MRLALTAAALCAILLAPAALAQECSISRTNSDCTLTIDRLDPLAPPTIQMFPGKTLTLAIAHPYFFERYFADFQSGQVALNPDVAAAIVNGMLAPLAKLQVAAYSFREQKVTPGSPPCTVPAIQAYSGLAPGGIDDTLDKLITGCLADFTREAAGLYKRLEPAVAPDSRPAGAAPDLTTLRQIAREIQNAFEIESELSALIAKAAALKDLPAGKAAMVRVWVNLGGLADAVAKDLYGYAARIVVLPSDSDGLRYPIHDPHTSYTGLVTRQVTYSLDAYNLVQNSPAAIPDPGKKRAIAVITILWGDAHWELSAGVLFSSLPNRSFAVAPVYSGTTLTDNQVSQSVTRPGVVPFVAANYRVKEFKSAWRTAAYLTAAIGINPNTTTADFAAGPSLSYRALLFSAFWHVGHDVELIGFQDKQSLGAGFNTTLPTRTKWRFDNFAFGISVRVPSLTGR